MTSKFKSSPSQCRPPASSDEMADAQMANAALQSRLKPVEWKNLITHITTRIKGEFNDSTIVRCPQKLANLDCVPTDPASVGTFSGIAAHGINAGMNTNVDFAALGAWEGGQHVQAYVPWWPVVRSLTAGRIEIDESKDRNGDLRGSSASGVTIGTGVDLGQQDAEYIKRLKKASVSDALIGKIKPYLGKTRSNACAYLREHPLRITKEEADMLDAEMKTHHLREAKRQFDNAALKLKNPKIKQFEALGAKEQTVLLSRQYQSGNLTGSPDRRLMDALAHGSPQSALEAMKLGSGGYPANGTFGTKVGDQDVGRIPKERTYLGRPG